MKLKDLRTILYTKKMKWLGVDADPSATIHPVFDTNNPRGIRLGKRAILYKQITMYCGKGNISLGDYSHCAPYCYFLCNTGAITIGDRVAVGPYCCFFTYSNSYDPTGAVRYFVDCKTESDIKIGNNVFIGSHSVILPGTVVDDDVIVAAGSVVKGHLETGYIYGGVPAKKIKPIWDDAD